MAIEKTCQVAGNEDAICAKIKRAEGIPVADLELASKIHWEFFIFISVTTFLK